MLMQVTADSATDVSAARTRPTARRLLMMLTGVALVASAALVAQSGSSRIDPDLVRVLRFMAAMKGMFAVIAFAACQWRLSRPADPWRKAVYVTGPPMMVVGAAGMWSLLFPGSAAVALHLGLLAILAASLTDRDFLPRFRIRVGR